MSRYRSIVVLIAAGLVFSGCGSSDDSGVFDTDLATFCETAAELNTSTEPPTDEQLDRLTESAPDEIREDAETLAASARLFRDGNENAADDPEIQEAGERFDTYVQANCGTEE